jgi:hypothetical protein
MKKKPNVVLIFVDNQPAKMLGCGGNDEIHTLCNPSKSVV